MLSTADNELLTRTGPGTPMGKLFRRFWLPALLPSELPEPDSADSLPDAGRGPGRLPRLQRHGRLLRAGVPASWRLAVLRSQRRVRPPLRVSRLEVRRDGTCVDMPNEPAESNFKTKVKSGPIRQRSAAASSGSTWDRRRSSRRCRSTSGRCSPAPRTVTCSKHLQESNYTQGLEGDLDSAHVTFLHRMFGAEEFLRGIPYSAPETTESRETEFGFVYGARRRTPDDDFYWRVTTYVFPTFTSIASPRRTAAASSSCPGRRAQLVVQRPAAGARGSGRAHRPRSRRRSGPFAYISQFDQSTLGLAPGTLRHMRNKDNDYLIDREGQRTHNFTGLPGNRIEDAAVTESMGPIYDRSKEHLGTTDVAVIHMRRELIASPASSSRASSPLSWRTRDASEPCPWTS